VTAAPPSPADLRDVRLTGSVVVLLGDRGQSRAEEHRALIALVAALTGTPAAAVSLSQVCASCGRSGHGPLRVHGAGAGVHVSLSRTDSHLALAVTGAGPVGIDLESVAALGRFPVDPVLCSPAESAALSSLPGHAADAARGALWTAKEAVLKAAGVGLRVDPRGLGFEPVTGGVERMALVRWSGAPVPLDRVHLLPVPAPAGMVASVAVFAFGRPRLRLVDAVA
jgi:4'-phosphopantetheinyl transferase